MNKATNDDRHVISIDCERGHMPGTGHRATCSCGWWSDCYSQMSDTERAIEVHLRRAKSKSFEDVLARSSIGAAVADVKARGIDAHLRDLERQMRPMRPRRQLRKKKTSNDPAFIRGFGLALASIWKLHHDAQLVCHILTSNGLTLDDFRDAQMLGADFAAIREAVKSRTKKHL